MYAALLASMLHRAVRKTDSIIPAIVKNATRVDAMKNIGVTLSL